MADNTEQTWPRAVTRYETSDGKTFAIEGLAADWQRALGAAELANLALEGGGDLADAYALFFAKAYTWKPAAETLVTIAALRGLTSKSQLIISHWQCRETPGYQPHRINPDGSIYVGGYAGSWSGGYGQDVQLRDLVRYVEDTRSRLGSIPEAA